MNINDVLLRPWSMSHKSFRAININGADVYFSTRPLPMGPFGYCHPFSSVGWEASWSSWSLRLDPRWTYKNWKKTLQSREEYEELIDRTRDEVSKAKLRDWRLLSHGYRCIYSDGTDVYFERKPWKVEILGSWESDEKPCEFYDFVSKGQGFAGWGDSLQTIEGYLKLITEH